MGHTRTIKLNNLFVSFDGEVNGYHQGRVATFIRLQGCNLRCPYCDAAQAQDLAGGKEILIEELAREARRFGTSKYTITGGEPFLQPQALCQLVEEIKWHRVDAMISIETNGTVPIPVGLSLEQVNLVVDYKLWNLDILIAEETFRRLRKTDIIKFVVGSKQEFEQALDAMDRILPLRGGSRPAPQFAFSPVHGQITPEELASWILNERLPDAILNLQLHKYIWPGSTKDC